jgi:hypothetical protein
LAISAGANVKVVQQMLGHATASMTLDLYGHLFPDQLDDIASRLDAIGRSARGLNADRSADNKLKLIAQRGSDLHKQGSRLWESNPRPTHYECVALAD